MPYVTSWYVLHHVGASASSVAVLKWLVIFELGIVAEARGAVVPLGHMGAVVLQSE